MVGDEFQLDGNPSAEKESLFTNYEVCRIAWENNGRDGRRKDKDWGEL